VVFRAFLLLVSIAVLVVHSQVSFVFPEFSIYQEPFLFLDRDNRELIYRKPGGELLFLSRKTTEEYLVIGYAAASKPGDIYRAILPDEIRLLDQPILIVDFYLDQYTSVEEIEKTIVHESFHVYFQQISEFDLRDLGLQINSKFVAEMEGNRQRLDQLFSQDAKFRRMILDQYSLLFAANEKIRDGEGLDFEMLELYFSIESKKWAQYGDQLRVAEIFWEFLEGTAQFVEDDYSRKNGLQMRESKTFLQERDSNYYLYTGSKLCELLLRLAGKEFTNSITPQTFLNLKSQLKARIR
jgi:hypothetical protein